MSRPTQKVTSKHPPSLLGAEDLYLFNEGSHLRLFDRLGCHITPEGAHFAVWAPDAERVSVVGDFNGWNPASHPLSPRESSGIWEGFVFGVEKGALYKYHLISRYQGTVLEKTDPFAFYQEIPPRTASVAWRHEYVWHDHAWPGRRRNSLHDPISIYEVHLGSWKRKVEEGNRWLTYRELAQPLVEHVERCGFTHVEFLPLMEHPFYGSWGYQTTGYFAPTSRYGTPEDFMYLVDTLHQHGIAVILDWVPSHFPNDPHGLGFFDGTNLFEHADPRQGFHPDWESLIFNYDRNEVRSFLLSSANFWIDRFHVDGLRVDAVASMLYLDYSRSDGEWIPNPHGGRENLGALSFLRRLNEEMYRHYPHIQMYAEESTSWPMVSRPIHAGGVGFGFKWDMGWMNDTLAYFAKDPVHRKFHHNVLTFRQLYSHTENFVLPLSHDEVVHGKGSLLGKMPGDDWQKFANLRLLYGYQFGQVGKKLLFMGAEFAPWNEWSHEASLDWHLLAYDRHQGILKWISDLNRLYRREPALHELDCEAAGFEWVDCNDGASSVLSFLRRGRSTSDQILVVCNFTPVVRRPYEVGVSTGGRWEEVLNSDATLYGGSGLGNLGEVVAKESPRHDRPFVLSLTLPPLAVLFFKHS